MNITKNQSRLYKMNNNIQNSSIKYPVDIPIRKFASQDEKSTIPLVFITSHERSGTHFLMNSIGQSQQIYTNDFVNFDYIPFGSFINFYSHNSIHRFISYLHQQQTVNLVKSHHHANFFKSVLGNNNIRFIYIYRNPYETLRSYWYFIHHFQNLGEGRVTNTLSEFIFSEPIGQQLRYQHHQERDMLDRWIHHVTGWLGCKRDNVLGVKYSDLVNKYSNTITAISEFLSLPTLIQNLWVVQPPDKHNYISVSPNLYDMYPISEKEELYIRDKIQQRLKERNLEHLYF